MQSSMHQALELAHHSLFLTSPNPRVGCVITSASGQCAVILHPAEDVWESDAMTRFVQAIRRVTAIMGEISSASSEQALGVSQVGEAVSQMDEVTQQNAALVEQMAAAASSLKNQAGELVEAVSVFRLNSGTKASAGHAAIGLTRF